MILFWMMLIFLVLLFAGMPVAFAMAISGMIAILNLQNVSLLLIPQRMYLSLDTFPILAVPFFILAGELMNRGGITKRIVDFAEALVGHFRGGLGQVNVVANILMAGVSGSASADAVAIGSVMIPAMVKAGYPARFAAGLTASAACIGPIIPPSIIMVIYGSLTNLSIGALFLGGFFPGILIGIMLMIIVFIYARKNHWQRSSKASLQHILRTFLRASWAIFAPVIIVGGIVLGIFTATEAGVVTVVYAFIVGFFIYKEIKLKDLWDILIRSALFTAVPLIILSGASVFGWVLARQEFSMNMTRFIPTLTQNPYIAYLIIVVILFIVGMCVEALAATIIFIPVLTPIAGAYGMDPIHFALVVIITMLIGTVTPPVGLQLYICSTIAQVPVPRVIIWPFVIAMTAALLIIVYFPPLVTWLPNLAFK
jgi:C4-dicarboxylate transporter DctM subunit